MTITEHDVKKEEDEDRFDGNNDKMQSMSPFIDKSMKVRVAKVQNHIN